MMMNSAKTPTSLSSFRYAPQPASRLGFHYFPDTLHYREADLQTWLPELTELGTGWLVLRSELDRAIPERFMRGIVDAGIAPLIQLDLPLDRMPDLTETQTLFEVYARWGARYLIPFERPNARSAWPTSSWAQQDLVERFLDHYLPVAGLALKMGLIPVFPGLEPGGSYWDTAFLRSALQAIQRRKQDALLQNLVLCAYGWRDHANQTPVAPAGLADAEQAAALARSLDWGAGGPERWPQARPYLTPPGSQDQRGFRIFDWYAAIARSVLQHPCPLILLQAGMPGDPSALLGRDTHTPADTAAYSSIAGLLAGRTVVDPLDESNPLEPIPDEVIAVNFWTLSAEPASPNAGHAWIQLQGPNQARVRTAAAEAVRAGLRAAPAEAAAQSKLVGDLSGEITRPIHHYLLLPGSEWGISDWYLEIIRPFVKKHKPTVGFSTEEAEHADRVTIVGNAQNYPLDLLDCLRNAGCWVEQIGGDGTDIASQLAER